jgi:hypothetical protein
MIRLKIMKMAEVKPIWRRFSTLLSSTNLIESASVLRTSTEISEVSFFSLKSAGILEATADIFAVSAWEREREKGGYEDDEQSTTSTPRRKG